MSQLIPQSDLVRVAKLCRRDYKTLAEMQNDFVVKAVQLGVLKQGIWEALHNQTKLTLKSQPKKHLSLSDIFNLLEEFDYLDEIYCGDVEGIREHVQRSLSLIRQQLDFLESKYVS